MSANIQEEFENLKKPPYLAPESWFRQRGYKFEALINAMLNQEGLSPRTSYKIQGEQIDGSFIYNGKVFLLEAKWHKSELPASSIYAFKGKVDGKLIGTIGIYISVSGYLPDTIDALSLGKIINILLFNDEDMVAATNPEIGFREVLEFKLRAAAEEGTVFAPFELVSAVTSKVPLFIICEGVIDKLILESINRRLGQIDETEYQNIEIIPAGGAFNLPKIANNLVSLSDKEVKVLMVADSDIGADRISKRISEQINFSNWVLVLPDPFIETWLFEDIEEFSNTRKYASGPRLQEAILKKSESLDVEKLANKDGEFEKYIQAIRSSSSS